MVKIKTKQDRREYQKKYREKNREKYLEYKRKYMREKRISVEDIPEHPFNYVDYIRKENAKKRSKIPDKVQPLYEVYFKRDWSI